LHCLPAAVALADSVRRSHPCRTLLAYVLLSIGTAHGLAAAEPRASDPESDFEQPDGDQSWAAALATYQAATDEDAALRALFNVVNLMRRRGDYADGLARGQEGLERARLAGDLARRVDFLYLLGRLYWSLGDYPRSLEMHFEELKLAGELGDPFVLARTHGGLGITYQRFGREAEALHHLEEGLEHAARAPDDRIRGSLLNSLGNYHLARREFTRAIELYGEALRIRERFGNARAIAETLTNLGLAADEQGEHARALDHLERALATFEALRYRRYIANTHRRIGRVLRHAGRFDASLASLERAREVATSLDSIEVMADVWQEFALTHEARGDFAAALDFQRRQAAAQSEARNTEDRRRMDELRARYDQEQRELEIALLKREQELQAAELARRRSHNFALAASLVVGAVLLGAVSIVQIVRLRAERRLHAASENARARAENAERLKTRLLQMASHDLKVPLVALHATAGVISRAAHDPAAVRRHATDIQADTARMRNLVRDFLEASAIEDGHLQLHPATLDLVAAAREAVASLLPLAAQKQQALRLDSPERPLPTVQADPERLRQVFENLVGNALKFTPTGSEVTLGFGTSGAWAWAEVRDNGPGLGPAEFARIFSPAPVPLFSPSTAADGSRDSTGLGLVIARELLTLQGGRLEVQSQPGRGAVFRVLLATAPEAVLEAETSANSTA
jgi:signal transduction histidine kinase